jgi:hypothetical protein
LFQIVVEEIIVETAPVEVQEEPTVLSPPPTSTSMFSFASSSKPKKPNKKEEELTQKALAGFMHMAHKVTLLMIMLFHVMFFL